MKRKGFLERDCQRLVNQDRNIFASCMVANGDADGLVTGSTRNYFVAYDDITRVIDPAPKSRIFGMSIIMVEGRTLFVADTTVHHLPSSEELADIADLPPWDIGKLVAVMDINSDGKINLPELDIALLNIRNTLGIEFIPYEEEAEAEDEDEVEVEEVTEAPSEADLKKMKKPELVELAKSMDLDSKGTKAVLIERITQA